jgi:WD40 repeat protein
MACKTSQNGLGQNLLLTTKAAD